MVIVNSKNSPEINIEIIAIFLKSFLFFNKGDRKNKYISPPYPNILLDPLMNVLFILVPNIGYILVILKFVIVPKNITIRLNNIKIVIIVFVFNIDLKPILLATAIGIMKESKSKYTDVVGKYITCNRFVNSYITVIIIDEKNNIYAIPRSICKGLFPTNLDISIISSSGNFFTNEQINKVKSRANTHVNITLIAAPV